MSGASLNWDEFEHAAKRMFNAWMDGDELTWAKETWLKLSEAGLTAYETELERTQVCIRLMTLAVIYLDFCYYAWEEETWPDFSDWAEALNVQPSQIGRLMAADHADQIEECEAQTDEAEFLSRAYLVLTDAQRSRIHAALCDWQPHDFHGLYLSLRLARRNSSEDAKDEAWEVTAGNSAALEFVERGFRRERDYC